MLSSLLQLAGLSRKWPQISEEEVAKHCTPQSLWIVAGNAVYDVTGALEDHPGGRSALMRRAGGVRDCTEDFMFHTRQTQRDIEAYKIGEVVRGSSSSSTQHSARSRDGHSCSPLVRRRDDVAETKTCFCSPVGATPRSFNDISNVNNKENNNNNNNNIIMNKNHSCNGSSSSDRGVSVVQLPDGLWDVESPRDAAPSDSSSLSVGHSRDCQSEVTDALSFKDGIVPITPLC